MRSAPFAKATVVELVVAELVEASKRPQKKTNEAGGFDKLSHRRPAGLNTRLTFRLITKAGG